MDEKQFNDLAESIRQMHGIRAGTQNPAKRTHLHKNEVAAIRKKMHMTQKEFAGVFRISVGTLRNWEQGHRNPSGAAVTLLKIAQKRPEAILEAMSV